MVITVGKELNCSYDSRRTAEASKHKLPYDHEFRTKHPDAKKSDHATVRGAHAFPKKMAKDRSKLSLSERRPSYLMLWKSKPGMGHSSGPALFRSRR
jgi:hypothetical protein